jgi:protein-L-isoaspartate(D-aspartate) O-methyltransferase
MIDATTSAPERARMVRDQLERRGIADARVLQAMSRVPREAFVPAAQFDRSYADAALPTSLGQTISQPYMVARMLELARIEPDDRVLDVGLGSGYQSAVLSHLCAEVVGIEILPELAERARQTLESLGIGNVEVHVGDGSLGFEARAPYQAILVAAFARDIPNALTGQLAPGGRLVIPIGTPDLQRLLVITRDDDHLSRTTHDACVYVPLLGTGVPAAMNAD